MEHNGQTYVSTRTDRGVRVYSPQNPRQSHYVTGNAAEPACTCNDFSQHGDCGHLGAAAHLLPANGPDQKSDACKGAQTVLVRRSVSPDGKINSLSVEFSFDVSNALVSEIRVKAEKTLALQTALIQSFLASAPKVEKQSCAPSRTGRNGNNGHSGNGYKGNGNDQHNGHNGNGAVPARLVGVGGMTTRFGYRTFIDVDCEGGNIKLFGNRKQLGEAIIAAGFPQMARNIADGVELNLPCRVLLSRDGQYPKIEKVLAANSNGSHN